MVLEIAQLGQPILRNLAQEIPPDTIADDAIQQLIRDMRDTLEEQPAAGLAGPQVFEARRIFLARVWPTANENELPGIEVFINPSIVERSEETELSWEGCLSFAELLVLVERHVSVTVEYFDAQGRHQKRSWSEFAARVIQHENDHLDGVLTIDRAPSTRYIIKESELDAFMDEMKKESETNADKDTFGS